MAIETGGYIAEKESATWFVSPLWKHRIVVVRRRHPTYFATDIAYHYNKFITRFRYGNRYLGRRPPGHVSRMEAVVGALGIDRNA